MKSGKYDISASEKTVWIHDENGQCVGRFSRILGEILTRHGYTIAAKHPVWDVWKSDAEKEFGIEIPQEMKPDVQK
jgi:hypothetical protein